MARKGNWAEAGEARNRYSLAAIAADAKLEKGVSDNRLLRSWESEMDVASDRSGDVASGGIPVTSARESMRCRHCGTPLQHSLIDLGMSPLCESFITEDQLDAPETYYPLHARVCQTCWLVQLPEFVSPAHIFTEYAYFSSYSTTWVAHAGRYCEMIKGRLGLGPESFVVELGSNDGYLLQHFVGLGVPVLGIEPAANVAETARQAGIPTLNAFFGPETAAQVVADRGHADLIVANNVLAQVPELNDFVVGMAHLLAPEGVVTIEVPHLERLIAENQFDTIYHEHFSYFSLGTMSRLAAAHGLALIDVETLPTHGGSLRVYLAHRGSRHPVSIRVADMLAQERRAGLEMLSTYFNFAGRIQRTKRELLSVLIKAKEDGKRICGYGAPGKGNTLLNYAAIGTDFLDFTVDRNPYKHGRYTPGMHIPILPVEAIDDAKPDYILILPWNLKDEIVQQMRYVGRWGAKFIVPIPSVAIIDPNKLFS
jgi:SAM-dependent methyltransferase